jgi:hypothetical protein
MAHRAKQAWVSADSLHKNIFMHFFQYLHKMAVRATTMIRLLLMPPISR